MVPLEEDQEDVQAPSRASSAAKRRCRLQVGKSFGGIPVNLDASIILPWLVQIPVAHVQHHSAKFTGMISLVYIPIFLASNYLSAVAQAFACSRQHQAVRENDSILVWALGSFPEQIIDNSKESETRQGDPSSTQSLLPPTLGTLSYIPQCLLWLMIMTLVSPTGASFFKENLDGTNFEENADAREWFALLARQSLILNAVLFLFHSLIPVYPFGLSHILASIVRSHHNWSEAKTAFFMGCTGELIGVSLIMYGVIEAVFQNSMDEIGFIFVGLFCILSSGYLLYLQTQTINDHPLFDHVRTESANKRESIIDHFPTRGIDPSAANEPPTLVPLQRPEDDVSDLECGGGNSALNTSNRTGSFDSDRTFMSSALSLLRSPWSKSSKREEKPSLLSPAQTRQLPKPLPLIDLDSPMTATTEEESFDSPTPRSSKTSQIRQYAEDSIDEEKKHRSSPKKFRSPVRRIPASRSPNKKSTPKRSSPTRTPEPRNKNTQSGHAHYGSGVSVSDYSTTARVPFQITPVEPLNLTTEEPQTPIRNNRTLSLKPPTTPSKVPDATPLRKSPTKKSPTKMSQTQSPRKKKGTTSSSSSSSDIERAPPLTPFKMASPKSKFTPVRRAPKISKDSPVVKKQIPQEGQKVIQFD